MSTVYEIVFLDNDPASDSYGEIARLPDLGIINAGGTVGPTFYVGDKPLLFADGTATDGSASAVLSITLQSAYDKGNNINLTAGRDLVFTSTSGKKVVVDSNTGKVTIDGDLAVKGDSTTVEGTIYNVDQVDINPPNGAITGLIIKPEAGVTMTSDLVQISVQNAGPTVFSIDAAGVTHIASLDVGIVNGYDFSLLAASITDHLNGSGIKHTGTEISVAGPFTTLVGTNVEEVLESIDQHLVTQAAEIRTYEHVQTVSAAHWLVQHNKASTRPTVTIYGDDGFQFWPDEIQIVDQNTISIFFNSPTTGRAVILLF
jgi:hypothetical protein